MDFPGKINNKKVKEAFLNILNDIEENEISPLLYLKAIIKLSLLNKEKNSITIINPINREEKLNISEILEYLRKHFYYKYATRGASILPVIAIYSLYKCIVLETKRFERKIFRRIEFT